MDRRRPYHHGDLRRALLTAALELVAERGPRGFTLTEVARRAGVSTAAPYRHFTDKADLLAAVAAVGFDQLHEALTEPGLPGDDAEALVELGRRYIRWAVDHGDAYQVMFGTDIDRQLHPELAAAAERAFGVVLHAVEALPGVPPPPLDDARTLAASLWALAHGSASLAIGGDLRSAGVTIPPEDLAAAAAAALVSIQLGARRRE